VRDDLLFLLVMGLSVAAAVLAVAIQVRDLFKGWVP